MNILAMWIQWFDSVRDAMIVHDNNMMEFYVNVIGNGVDFDLELEVPSLVRGIKDSVDDKDYIECCWKDAVARSRDV